MPVGSSFAHVLEVRANERDQAKRRFRRLGREYTEGYLSAYEGWVGSIVGWFGGPKYLGAKDALAELDELNKKR